MMEDQFYDQQTLVSKGKRTKRQRTMSPLVLTMATTTSSSCSSGGGGVGDGGFCDLNLSCGGGGGGGGSGGGGDHFIASPSTNSSSELLQSKVDEEDMANCLILLAQGRRHHPEYFAGINDSKKISPDGGDVYECKTCNRRFHSFQALGGHRASHRKPKLLALSEDHKKQPENNSQQLHHKFNNNTSVLSLQVSRGKDSCNNNNNNKTRVHECLICGAEFSSGQALGGHMRRHRPLPVAGAGASSSTTHDDSTQELIKKSRLEVLGLDLNQPAPAEDDQHPRGSVFTFASKDQVPVFATSQLVHCHY